MSTIPANQIANVVPSVIGAGGTALDVIGLMLTTSTRVPIGEVPSFPNQTAVASYFGGSSDEAAAATTYFKGFKNSSRKPAALRFAQYNEADAAAYIRGGNVSSLSLAQLQALNGSLALTVDGLARSAGSVNLSSATSFSSGASIIQTALNASLPSAASITASIGGVVTASAGATFTGSGSGTNLTASAVVGVIELGAAITGTGVPAGTYIVSQTSGSAGAAGVYVTNNSTTSSGASLVATSNVLNVTGVTSGTLQASDLVTGTGVTAASSILSQLSGAPGGVGRYILSVAQQFASTAVTASSNVLNVTAVGSGTVVVGDPISGTNVTASSTVTAQISGSGGTGTYRLSQRSTTISEAMTVSAAGVVVSYDSQSGGFVVTSGIAGAASTIAYATGTISANLKLTSATGAVLSQGAAAATPASVMNGVIAVTTDWVTFMTLFDPDGGSGNTVKQAFADWNDSQNDTYGYVCWDTDASPTVSLPATGSLGYLLANNNDSGTCLIWAATAADGVSYAAFICGAAASIDFTETNGKVDFAFLQQDGLTADVTDATTADNLAGSPQGATRGNGYNFYGAYGAATENFVWFQRGFVTGDFLWLDSYINQIWLNNSFQSALLNFRQSARSVPYDSAGYARIEAALAPQIQAGLNFGAYAPGNIDDTQAAEVNAAAGAKIATTLETQGWYLQISPASSSVRSARTSPPMKFWYLDRGSVQAFTLDSIAVE